MRGVVIDGHIIDREIDVGDRIELNVQGVVIKLFVKSSEVISSSDDKMNVELMVGHLGDDVLAKVNLFQGQVVIIIQ